MEKNDISQVPVTNDGRIVGAVSESIIFSELIRNPEIKNHPVSQIMNQAFPFADVSTPLDALARMITPETTAVMVKDFKTDENYIITRHDIIKALSL
jgi:cystathionine beta-synthase